MPRKLATHYFWMCVRVFVEEISIIMDAGDFSDGSVVKNPSANLGDTGLIPDPGISTCHRAAKPMGHSLEPVLWSLGATTAEALGPWSPCSATREATAVRSPRITPGE